MKRPEKRPLTLIILDGFGHRDNPKDNAIAAANKPNWEHFLATSPHSYIEGSGKCVGLPAGQMGNSEVGHLNIGAGRIVYQDLTRIDLAIENSDFFSNPVLVNAMTLVQQNKKAVHIMGLLSPGGVHSHENHLQAIVKLAARMQVPALYLHAFLDGRDTPPKSALQSIKSLESVCKTEHCGQIASLIGRYYAMDRDKRWERVEEAYNLLTAGNARYTATNAEEGLALAYERGETDEFVKATSIHPKEEAPITIQDGDVMIFMNFRSDRAREITQAFIDPAFSGFKRHQQPTLGAFICLSQYDKHYPVPVAFPPQSLSNIFADCISKAEYKQLRIAETEKYAHVTFFFNGGVEQPFPGEERLLIPSPKVATYNLQPEMSALELTEQLIKAIKSDQYDVIICNYANPDMVGHTGDFAATVKAIETIDTCLGQVAKALAEVGGEAIITADHGNAECMYDHKTNQPHTAHTADPVPFIFLGRAAKISHQNGKLSDIAPTMLRLLGLPQPQEMTGQPLLELV